MKMKNLLKEMIWPVMYDFFEALTANMADYMDDQELADAFATMAQFRQQKKKPFGKKGSSAPPSNGPYPFKATGELSFDAKAKEQRKAAVRFLKSVTQRTACNQKGHWVVRS